MAHIIRSGYGPVSYIFSGIPSTMYSALLALPDFFYAINNYMQFSPLFLSNDSEDVKQLPHSGCCIAV